ncbi:TonB-dependent receptor [Pollutibacter soli]|uniref:TonB-dependent receptor n=1 Tax=Pollutibacter soli TaxID=3034157 RepID=UPI003013DB2D
MKNNASFITMPDSKRSAILFILPMFLLISGTSFSQQNQHLLFVAEEKTRVPLSDVLVQSKEAGIFRITNENGFIRLAGMPRGDGFIVISRIGYATQKIKFADLSFINDAATVYLSPAVTSLTEIAVKAGHKGGIFKTISDLDIHVRPINNTQEVLRIVPGVFIGQHAGGGKAEQLFLRGFDLDHGTDIQINVDGIPVNMVSHAHGQGYADLHFVIPELIEKVQFNKGPYFGDKGNFTTAGFVDFSTRRFLKKNFVKVEGGQYNSFRAVTAVNLIDQQTEHKTQSLYFAGEAMYTRGYFESPQDFNRFNGILKYHTLVNNSNYITAMFTGFSSSWSASGQIPERKITDGTIGFFGAIDDTEGGRTSRYNGIFEWNHQFKDGSSLNTLSYLTRYNFELYSNFTFFKVDSVNGDQIRQKENRWITGLTSRYEKNFQMAKLESQTNAGVQIRYDKVENLELSGTMDRKINTRNIMLGKVNELNAGIFWIQKLMINKNFDITPSLRADYFRNNYNDYLVDKKLSTSSVIVSPKLNFNYRINSKLELYLYSGKGFHSNDTRVAVQQNGKKVVPPAWGADLGAIVKPFDKLIFQSAIWYLWLDQEFIYVGDEGIVEAGGKSQRYGIDFSARYELMRSFYVDVDINLAKAKALGAPEGKSYLPLAPTFTSTGGFTYRKTSNWNGSLRYRYMHHRPANEDYSTIAKGYFIVDAAINYTRPEWEAGLQIQNLLNSKWKETQFDTESKLKGEPEPVTEIHFTPGTPFFARLSLTFYF